MVITGMHHSFIAVETTLITIRAKQVDRLFSPIATMSNVAQGGAALAAFLIIKIIRNLKVWLQQLVVSQLFY